MRNYKKSSFVLLLLFSFFLIGCQKNNSETGPTGAGATSNPSFVPSVTDSNVTVILPVSASVVTLNNEAVNIQVKVYDNLNTPYSSGNIKVIYPDEVKAGRDVGSFQSITVPVNNGIANFAYTAPNNLESDTSDIYFSFYHDSEPSRIKTFTISISPTIGQTILSSYKLNSSIGTDVSIGLNSEKLISFYVQNEKNELLEDSKINSITISLMNPSLATLEDRLGNTGTSLTVNSKNNANINIKSNTKSGIVPIKIDAVFLDVNSKIKTLSEVFNILVLSGPPSAMSLSYAGTDQIAEHAKFVENWVLTVTDKYNNLVNTNPAVSMGMIAGFAQDSSHTATNIPNYLFFSPGTKGGVINPDTDTFTAINDVFTDIDLQNDILVTFGNGYTYNASGKWDISTKSATVLGLRDDYTSANTANLGFAVGHNQRDETCSDSGAGVVANVYPLNDNYIIDSTGSLILKVEYDYYLVGKSTILWVNLVGKDYATDETVKIGEAKKVTLRGSGLDGESYSFSKGFQGMVRLNVSISNTVEWYKNANFAYKVSLKADNTSWNIVGTSMDNNITSCYHSGIAYVDVNITAGGDGTVSLENVLPTSEI